MCLLEFLIPFLSPFLASGTYIWIIDHISNDIEVTVLVFRRSCSYALGQTFSLDIIYSI